VSRQSNELTPAQWSALVVLAGADGQVEGWKRSSRSQPCPMVNIRAVGALCDQGLARMHMRDSRFWSPFRHDGRYTITPAGRERFAEEAHPVG